MKQNSKAHETREDIRDALEFEKEVTVPGIMEEFGRPRRTVRNAFERLVRDDEVVVSNDKKGNVKVYVAGPKLQKPTA